jgi:hypothetical protein
MIFVRQESIYHFLVIGSAFRIMKEAAQAGIRCSEVLLPYIDSYHI